VILENGVINPAEITIAADTDVMFSVENAGTFPHTFAILDQPDLTTGVLDPGAVGEFVANLPAGTYVTWCEVEGHREAGMEGVLIVA
jgi:uncharacterized cupredoxin-like copper-binding protein